MVTVEEAAGIIFSHLFPKRIMSVPLEEAVGSVLAAAVHADRAFPPFHRVAMDGIAISFNAWNSGIRIFPVAAVQAAGEKALVLTDTDTCIEVMTGAVVPEGTDTVIRYEDLDIRDNVATISLETIDKGQNIHVMGSDATVGQELLGPGIVLSPAEIAMLAAVGISDVPVYDFPRTAIISSGDELIDITATPEAHQIRRSNTYAIEAAMLEMKWRGTKYHFPDDRDILITKLRELVDTNEVLILSGGVSKGKFDYIPEALAAAGVEQKFHLVRQRPGKPFWFGVTSAGKVVFALPGNPVSTYMCFYRYIKPWIMKSFGVQHEVMEVILGSDVHFPPPLTYFLQVNVTVEQGKLVAIPYPGGGSGDFANLREVSGFLQLPPGRTAFRKGEVYPYIPFRRV